MKMLFKSVLIVSCMAMGTMAFAQNGITSADRGFAEKVSQGGMFEVAAGKLAMVYGSTQDIRDLANAEVHDHMLVNDKLHNIAAHSGIGLAPVLNPGFAGKMRYLSSLRGPAFDKAYLNEMSSVHDADASAFADEFRYGGTPALRAFSGETRRIVMRHIGAIRAVPVM